MQSFIKDQKKEPRLQSVSMESLREWGKLHGWTLPSYYAKTISESAARCEELLNQKDHSIYGIHTGFGHDVSASRKGSASDHQTLLIRFLSVGMGSFLPESVVRRAIRLQIEKTLLGFSGLSLETFEALLELQGRVSLPPVPRYGSLGASGDLIPMAHAVAPLFDSNCPGPRDGLSLVNTNSMMTSLAVELFGEIQKLWSKAVACTGKASCAAGFDGRHFTMQGLAPASQGSDTEVAEVGAMLRQVVDQHACGMNESSHVQARYSLRCAPMVLGASLWNLRRAEERILWEARRVADNPLVLEEGFFHGGHFYAIGIAQAADLLSDVCGRVCEMLDRQVLTLMDPDLSGLARNLETDRDHCKGLSQLISSLYQRLRGMMVPSRALSFSCEGNNQDIVPCGMSALISLGDQIEVATHVVRAAEFCINRALCLRAGRTVPFELGLDAWRGRDLGH